MGMRLDHVGFLIVDDNDHMRRLIRLILRNFGAGDIREAQNGDDAIEAMRDRVPDVLITDWAMDPMDGIELTRYVRKSKDSPNVYMPIIMITGFAERQRVFTARDAGVTEFLVKPISATALFSRISTIVEKPRRFVRVGQFFGPDRRRRKDQWTGEERRGPSGAVPKPGGRPAETAMTQAEINTLFNP